MPNREVLFNETQIAEARHGLDKGIDFSTTIEAGIIPRRTFRSYAGEKIALVPIPNEAICPKSSELLKDDDYTKDFFADRGFEIAEALHIINRNKHRTTDFIGAGILMIEDNIHSPGNRKEFLRFVAQPSFRTQHVGGINPGFSPAFVNLASVGIGLDFGQHCAVIKHWEDYLVSLGMDRANIQYQENWVQKQWGATNMTGHEVYFCYQGFPLGDASFNTVTDGDNAGFSFSDTGFGLERIKWLLQGGEYQQTFSSSNSLYENKSYPDICRLHALTLLVGQDVRPGANGDRARVRKLSREYANNHTNPENTGEIVSDYYDNWSAWTSLSINKADVVNIILQENQNNARKTK
jgi:hypothetical protein